MKKIDIKTIDGTQKLAVFDLVRDGRSRDFDTLKVTAIISELVDNTNELIDLVTTLRNQVSQLKSKKSSPKKKVG